MTRSEPDFPAPPPAPPNFPFWAILLISAALFAVAFWVRPANSAELDTTLRVGDIGPAGPGCFTKEDALLVAAGARPDEAMQQAVAERRCFTGPRQPMPAVLVEWVGGPFVWGETEIGVWRVNTPVGEVYLFIPDDAGDNKPARKLEI